jgi:hypothetical protein
VYVGSMLNGLPEGKGEFVYGQGAKKWEKYIGMITRFFRFRFILRYIF